MKKEKNLINLKDLIGKRVIANTGHCVKEYFIEKSSPGGKFVKVNDQWLPSDSNFDVVEMLE